MKKLEVVREVRAVVVYRHLYIQRDDDDNPILDENREQIPIRFIYPCTVLRKADADLEESESKLGGKAKLSSAEKLSRLLTKEPEGFENFAEPFPMDARTLQERALEYFSKPDMEGFAGDALLARANTISPWQLFRES